MKKIGIFGTSGMAREAGDIACALGFQPLYIARDQAELDAWSFPADAILEEGVQNHPNIGFVIGIGENTVRQVIAQRFSGTLRFINLIHPSATFGQGQRQLIEAQQGVIVCAGVRFTSSIQVGDFCIFNQNATVAHDVIIEDFVHVAPGSTISGNVHVGSRCWIGSGAIVNQGTGSTRLHIGVDTVIGSGAVVIKPCESNAVYVGVPAKRIK